MMDELLVNLTTIGKLSPGDKLAVEKGKIYISSSRYQRPLKTCLREFNIIFSSSKDLVSISWFVSVPFIVFRIVRINTIFEYE